LLESLFQSSPGPRAGCNLRMLTPRSGFASFNPHPARGPGATQLISIGPIGSRFQSSPGPRAGCNPAGVTQHPVI